MDTSKALWSNRRVAQQGGGHVLFGEQGSVDSTAVSCDSEGVNGVESLE